MSAFAHLFPAGDYRFHLTLRRGEPADFFRPQDASGGLLAERRRWLENEPARHAALLPEGTSLLDEFCAMARDWARPAGAFSAAQGERWRPTIHELGAALEPDLLLLSPDADGRFRLRGGTVCFASGWALTEKMGQTVDFIHDVVPGLNATLASPIHQFLSRMKPGIAFLRDNWGLAATDARNLHPALGLPAPAPPVALDRLWLRVEEQALVALPQTAGIAFGIRIALCRLDVLAREPAGEGLRRALATMPPEMAAYKRLEGIRADLIKLL
ncbi:MAG: DUF3445 domain-containing protein [Opitutus sp.]|nr:DUF3445 domain-containing protein [Opitutus sp.]